MHSHAFTHTHAHTLPFPYFGHRYSPIIWEKREVHKSQECRSFVEKAPENNAITKHKHAVVQCTSPSPPSETRKMCTRPAHFVYPLAIYCFALARRVGAYGMKCNLINLQNFLSDAHVYICGGRPKMDTQTNCAARISGNESFDLLQTYYIIIRY